MYDRLVALRTTLGLGEALGTQDWAIFRNTVPEKPLRVVSLIDAPASLSDIAMDTSHPILESLTVQIRVRGVTIDETSDKLDTILGALRSTTHATETDGNFTVVYQTVRTPNTGFFVPASDRGGHEKVANVELVREVTKR